MQFAGNERRDGGPGAEFVERGIPTSRFSGTEPRFAQDAAASGLPQPGGTRHEPARYGSWRALLWSSFIALAFFELTNPTRIIPDFPAANVVLAGITGVVLILDYRNLRLPRMPWPVVAYLALCGASALWSIAPSETGLMTLLYAWVALLACICVAQADTQTLLRGIAWGGVLVVAVTLGSVVVDPERFGGGLLFPGTGPGVHGTKGIVAYSVVLAITAALMRRPLARRGWLEVGLTLAINVVGVVITSASTGRLGAVAVVAGWVVVLWLRRLRGPALTRGWRVVGFVATAVVLVVVIARDRITDLLGETSDFNGRFVIWQAVVGGWLEAPITGHGFGAVWFYGWWRLDGSPVLERMNRAANLEFYHGHNLFLDLLPQLGALGLVAALLLLGVLVVRGVVGLPSGSAAPGWALLVLVAMLVMGVAEPMLSVPVGWFSVVTASAAAHARPVAGGPAEPRQSVGSGGPAG